MRQPLLRKQNGWKKAPFWRLSFLEGPIIAFFLFLIFTICFVSTYQTHRLSRFSYEEKTIHVKIKGEVKKPGSYQLGHHVPLSELLRKASLKKFASTAGLDLSRPLEDGEEIVILPLEFVECTVVGALKNPGVFRVPVGTCICDLKKILDFDPGADLSPFKSKKQILNNQVVEIICN